MSQATAALKGGADTVGWYERRFEQEGARFTPLTLAVTVMTLSFFSSSQYLVYRFPTWWGLASSYALLLFLYVFDIVTNPGARRNMARMKKRGITGAWMHGGAVWGVSLALIPPLVMRLLHRDATIAFASVVDGLEVAGLIVAAMALGEVAFTLVHKHLLHRRRIARHWWHHLCREASISSTYWFHPLDVVIEFSMPVTIVLILALVAHDYRVYFWGTTVILTWYAADHDSLLRLPHWYHHKNVDHHYSVYIPSREHDERDLVKQDVA